MTKIVHFLKFKIIHKNIKKHTIEHKILNFVRTVNFIWENLSHAHLSQEIKTIEKKKIETKSPKNLKFRICIKGCKRFSFFRKQCYDIDFPIFKKITQCFVECKDLLKHISKFS